MAVPIFAKSMGNMFIAVIVDWYIDDEGIVALDFDGVNCCIWD